MDVRDPQAAQIALSPELPPQAARWRLRLVVRLARQHHELSWSTFTDNVEMLLSPNPKYRPLITAQADGTQCGARDGDRALQAVGEGRAGTGGGRLCERAVAAGAGVRGLTAD
jgi:hypothetical protein